MAFAIKQFFVTQQKAPVVKNTTGVIFYCKSTSIVLYY